jgi:hypothetical protein
MISEKFGSRVNRNLWIANGRGGGRTFGKGAEMTRGGAFGSRDYPNNDTLRRPGNAIRDSRIGTAPDRNVTRSYKRAGRIAVSSAVRTFLSFICPCKESKFVSARCRCNGREATARLSNQHAGSVRSPKFASKNVPVEHPD